MHTTCRRLILAAFPRRAVLRSLSSCSPSLNPRRASQASEDRQASRESAEELNMSEEFEDNHELIDKLDPEIEEETEKKKTIRGTPEGKLGKSFIGCVALPKQVEETMNSLLSDYKARNIRPDALQLIDAQRHPHFSLSPKSPKSTPMHVATGIPTHKLTYGPREARASLAVRFVPSYAVTINILNQIKKRYPEFDPKTVMDFGCGAGSGVIASRELFWNDVESNSKRKAVLVDLSDAQLHLAREMLESSEHEKSHLIDYEYHKMVSPVEPPKDLVIAAFVLGELVDNPTMFENTLATLWAQTGDMLVIAERGTPIGFEIVAKAREWVLNRSRNDIEEAKQQAQESAKDVKRRPDIDISQVDPKVAETLGLQNHHQSSAPLPTLSLDHLHAHVVAPCPHDGACPIHKHLQRLTKNIKRQNLKKKDRDEKERETGLFDDLHEEKQDMKGDENLINGLTWCHFRQKVQRTRKMMDIYQAKVNWETTKFSYVVIRRGPRPSPSSQPNDTAVKSQYTTHHSFWPRIVSPVLQRKQHRVLDLCTPDGDIVRTSISHKVVKGKVGGRSDRIAREKREKKHKRAGTASEEIDTTEFQIADAETLKEGLGKGIWYDVKSSKWGDLWPWRMYQSSKEIVRITNAGKETTREIDELENETKVRNVE